MSLPSDNLQMTPRLNYVRSFRGIMLFKRFAKYLLECEARGSQNSGHE